VLLLSAQCSHFFFLMEGEVQLQRGGVNLGALGEGSFVGEAALFADIKQADGDDGKFTTSVAITSPTARMLKLFIGDFYPLVYHQHPGATAIVQRLGRIMVSCTRLQNLLPLKSQRLCCRAPLLVVQWPW